MRAAVVFLALLLALGAGILAGLWASDSGSASPGGSLSCVVKPSCTGSEVAVLEGGAPANEGSAGPFSGLTAGWLFLGGLVVVGLVLVQRRHAGGRP